MSAATPALADAGAIATLCARLMPPHMAMQCTEVNRPMPKSAAEPRPAPLMVGMLWKKRLMPRFCAMRKMPAAMMTR